MNNEKAVKWAAIGVGLVISVAVVWFGFSLVSQRFGKAADLNVSNFNCEPTGENSLLVTWEDTSSQKGVVYYRPAGTVNNLISLEENAPQAGSAGNLHEVTLHLLTAGTSYDIQVGSGDEPEADVHSCSTKQGMNVNSVIPTTSIVTEPTNTPAPTTTSRLSVEEIKDRYRDGTFKNGEDCASSSQTTALDCAKAARALYGVQGQSVSR